MKTIVISKSAAALSLGCLICHPTAEAYPLSASTSYSHGLDPSTSFIDLTDQQMTLSLRDSTGSVDGIAFNCPFTGQGKTYFNYLFSDSAGNSSVKWVGDGYSTLTFNFPVGFKPVAVGFQASKSFTFTDNGNSGILGPLCDSGILITSADGVSPLAYVNPVTYAFNGFFRPIDNPSTLNRVNAGRNIPVKFSLTGNKGLNILALGYPTSRAITCDTAVTVDDVEETTAAGPSELHYDSVADQYIYSWSTTKAWAATCRQLTVRLNDGTDHKANFQFK